MKTFFEISNYDMISVRKIFVVRVSLFLFMFGTNVIAGIFSIWFVHLLIWFGFCSKRKTKNLKSWKITYYNIFKKAVHPILLRNNWVGIVATIDTNPCQNLTSIAPSTTARRNLIRNFRG